MKAFSIRFAVAGMIVGSFAMANIQEKKEEKFDRSALGIRLPKKAEVPPMVPPMKPELKPEVAPVIPPMVPPTKPELKPEVAPMPREVLPMPREVKPATTAPSVRPPSNFLPTIPQPPKVEPKKESKNDSDESSEEDFQHVRYVGPVQGLRIDPAWLVPQKKDEKPEAEVLPLPREVKPELAPAPREVKPEVLPMPREVKPAIAPAPREVKPEALPMPREVKPAIAPAPREVKPEALPMPREVKPEAKPEAKPEVKPVTAPSFRPPSNFLPTIPQAQPKPAPKADAPKANATEDSLAKILGQLSPAMQFTVLADLDLHHGANAAALRERIAKLDPKLNKALLTGRNFSLLSSSLFKDQVKKIEVTKGADGRLTVKVLFADGSQLAVSGIAGTDAEIAAALKDTTGALALALVDQFDVGLRTIERKEGKDGDVYAFSYEAKDRRKASAASSTKSVAKSETHGAPKK